MDEQEEDEEPGPNWPTCAKIYCHIGKCLPLDCRLNFDDYGIYGPKAGDISDEAPLSP